MNGNEETTKPWRLRDCLYDSVKNIYAKVISTDEYRDGSGVITIETEGGCIGSGTQRALREFTLIEKIPPDREW